MRFSAVFYKEIIHYYDDKRRRELIYLYSIKIQESERAIKALWFKSIDEYLTGLITRLEFQDDMNSLSMLRRNIYG